MTKPMTDQRLKEITARRAKILYAPWSSCTFHKMIHARGGCEGGSCVVEHSVYDREDEHDFIANAPTDIDDLLAEVERLKADLSLMTMSLAYSIQHNAECKLKDPK